MEIIEAELSVCENASSFLQSPMWGEFKSKFGWSAKAFLIEWQNSEAQEKTPLLVLCRSLAPGFSFAYVPWGPQLPDSFSAEHPAQLPADERPKMMSELAKKLKKYLSRNVFIRFDFPWFFAELPAELPSDWDENLKNESALLRAAGFKKAAATVQPPDTVIINLEDSCEAILSQMKSKWRYNISLAEKKGVEVITDGTLEAFYNLLNETAQRDGIAVHGFNYYKTLFELYGKDIRLYMASHEGEALAGIVVLFRGKDATYLYGASSNNKRNLMAPYALQWKAMQDAKDKGCINYDLFGIPPNEDLNHPMAGLYRFKTGFGGQIIHRHGSMDYPYQNIVYKLFKIAETFRKKLMNLKKNKR